MAWADTSGFMSHERLFFLSGKFGRYDSPEHGNGVLISQTVDEADELAESGGMYFSLKIGHFVLLWCEQAPRGVGYDTTCTWGEVSLPYMAWADTSGFMSHERHLFSQWEIWSL